MIDRKLYDDRTNLIVCFCVSFNESNDTSKPDIFVVNLSILTSLLHLSCSYGN